MTKTGEKTGFFWHEKCFWHYGGNYAFLTPVGGPVQPSSTGGHPESPETKRRLKNLIDTTELANVLEFHVGKQATREDLLRIHPKSYLDEFKSLSDGDGGTLGFRTPFGKGAYEIAALSAGLVVEATEQVLQGKLKNAYALSRPPGHHCLPDHPNGFCLLNNIAIAIEAAKNKGLVDKIAVVDWDVHHGNGTEAIFYERSDVLSISIHQHKSYPYDQGLCEDVGKGDGVGANMNIPLPAGSGHNTYLEAMRRLVMPKLQAYQPDLVIVACGFDASGVDPLARMMCNRETYREMTRMLMDFTNGRFVAAHEGGYSELYVPFCGVAVLEEMSGCATGIEDPLAHRLSATQPGERMEQFCSGEITRMAEFFELS